ncbi:hypothetical protein A2U01_0057894, partial [Trifolium medium]|nr:hypothetical protein [Trifolium medium]
MGQRNSSQSQAYNEDGSPILPMNPGPTSTAYNQLLRSSSQAIANLNHNEQTVVLPHSPG